MIELLSGLAILLLVLTLLAAVGLVTLAAFALMAALGLITDWSFKKIFFISFALGLFAPILAGGAVGSAIADGSLQRELQQGLNDSIIDRDGVTISVEDANGLREILPPRRDLEELLQERPDLRERIPEQVLEQLLERSDEIERALEAQDGVTIEGDIVTDSDGN